MMKRLSLILVASAGLLAIGSGACSLNLPGPPDLSAPPPDLATTGGGGDMTEPLVDADGTD